MPEKMGDCINVQIFSKGDQILNFFMRDHELCYCQECSLFDIPI